MLVPGDYWRLALQSRSYLCGSHLEAREKTDVVILKNGDRITGEIKKLDRGKLKLKTDDMSTVYIELDLDRADLERVRVRDRAGERPAILWFYSKDRRSRTDTSRLGAGGDYSATAVDR